MKNATGVFASTFGAIWAPAGIEHGIGEMLQGRVAPSGVMFPSWPDSAFFRSLNREPAMTVIPDLLITGILANLFSLALLVWAILFVRRKNGSLIMILLPIGMLLVGGGIFPLLLGIIIGAVATRIHAPASSKTHRFGGFRRSLAWLVLGILWCEQSDGHSCDPINCSWRSYPDSIIRLCIRYPDAIRLMITINSARM